MIITKLEGDMISSCNLYIAVLCICCISIHHQYPSLLPNYVQAGLFTWAAEMTLRKNAGSM